MPPSHDHLSGQRLLALPPHCSSSPPHIGPTMAFRKVLKRTAILGGGAVATVYGLSQLIEYRKKQVSWRRMLSVHQMLFSCKTSSFAAFHCLAAGKIQGQMLNPSVFWVWQQSDFQLRVCSARQVGSCTVDILECARCRLRGVSFFIKCFSAAVLQASAHSQRKEDQLKTFPFYLHMFSSTSCSINCVLFINCNCCCLWVLGGVFFKVVKCYVQGLFGKYVCTPSFAESWIRTLTPPLCRYAKYEANV